MLLLRPLTVLIPNCIYRCDCDIVHPLVRYHGQCRRSRCCGGFHKFCRVNATKLRSYDVVERVAKKLERRSHKVAMFRCCGGGCQKIWRAEVTKLRCCGGFQKFCRVNATKLQSYDVATLQDWSYDHPALPV